MVPSDTAYPVNHYVNGPTLPPLPEPAHLLPELTFPPELELALPLPVTTPTFETISAVY